MLFHPSNLKPAVDWMCTYRSFKLSERSIIHGLGYLRIPLHLVQGTSQTLLAALGTFNPCAMNPAPRILTFTTRLYPEDRHILSERLRANSLSQQGLLFPYSLLFLLATAARLVVGLAWPDLELWLVRRKPHHEVWMNDGPLPPNMHLKQSISALHKH